MRDRDGISYDRRGSGSPIVLVHGLGSRWQCFAPVLDALAEDHEVIAVDLPGFGASPLLPGVVPGPRGYAGWLEEWLRHQGVHRPHVVGSSMGGGVALELGRRGVAGRVTAFSPVGFYGRPGLRWVSVVLTTLRLGVRCGGPLVLRLLDPPAGRKLLLAALFGHPSRVPPDVARDDARALAGASAFTAARDSFDAYRLAPADDVGHLADVPVTVAWGTRDAVLWHRTQSARARVVLPSARHLDLPGCGHLPFSDDPERCVAVVREQPPAG